MTDDDPGEKELNNYYEGCNKIVGYWYEQYRDNFFLLACRHLNDKTLAWDAVHDVFEKLIKYPVSERNIKLKPTSSIENSLKLRVRTRSIDIIRRELRKTTISIDNFFHIKVNSIDIEVQLEINDTLSCAIKIAKTNKLFSRNDLYIIDAELKRYSNQEMADHLHMPKEKLAKRKHKLKRILQRIIINKQ